MTRSQLPPSKSKDFPEQFIKHSYRLSMPTPTRPQLPRKDSSGSDSPRSPTGRYTAMLDLGRSFQAPAPPPRRPKQMQSTTFNETQKDPVLKLTFPEYAKKAPTPPQQYRHSSLPSPPLARTPSSHSPVSPIIPLRTRVSLDPNYRGGYESDKNLQFAHVNLEPTPIYRPLQTPGSPRTNQPPRPRISTNFDVVMPLKIQHVSSPVEIQEIIKPKEVHFIDDGITSADVQSQELTNIVNGYLDEIVSDATSRGVMSSRLEGYLKSPTIMGEWDNVQVDIVVPNEEFDGLKGTRNRFVSIVRRALRN